MEGVAQAPPRAFLPPLIASLSLSLVCSAPDFIALLRRGERILRRFECWLVGVERDDVGREEGEGEGCFLSKPSVVGLETLEGQHDRAKRFYCRVLKIRSVI